MISDNPVDFDGNTAGFEGHLKDLLESGQD